MSTPFGSSIYVKKVTGGSGTLVSTATVQPCSPSWGSPDSVIAGVDLQSAALPSGLQNIFTVDIPFLPTIDLRSAEVEGEFRCER